MILASIGALALGSAGWWAFSGTGSSATAVAPATERIPPPNVAAAPRTGASLPPAPGLTPVAALDAVLAGADPTREVSVQVASRRLRIDRDKIQFSIQSAHAGHVYVYMVGTQGNDFHLLFPNAIDANNRIGAGETLQLPRPAWPVTAVGPQGTDHFVVMVSDMPRDFGVAGLRKDGDFGAFPIERATELQRTHTGASPLYAGVPVCPGTPCAAAYGAAAFSVEEVAE